MVGWKEHSQPPTHPPAEKPQPSTPTPTDTHQTPTKLLKKHQKQERAIYEAGRTIDLDAIPFRPGDRVDVLQVRCCVLVGGDLGGIWV